MANDANFQYILKAIADKGSGLSDVQRDILAGVVRQGKQTNAPFSSYSVTVNYNKTVDQLVKDGKYDWANDDVSDPHFPLNKKGEEQAEIFIVTIDRRMSNAEIDQILDRWGLQDANVKEGLSLGAQYPNLQREGPIVARGSTWRVSDGGVFVPCLRGGESRRDLGLSLVGGWYSCWQFAAVRK